MKNKTTMPKKKIEDPKQRAMALGVSAPVWLKELMTAASEQHKINWSLVAREAFELKLNQYGYGEMVNNAKAGNYTTPPAKEKPAAEPAPTTETVPVEVAPTEAPEPPTMHEAVSDILKSAAAATAEVPVDEGDPDDLSDFMSDAE